MVLAAGVQDGLSVAVPLGKVGAAEDGLDSGLGVVAVVVDVHKEEDVLLIEIVSGIHVESSNRALSRSPVTLAQDRPAMTWSVRRCPRWCRPLSGQRSS